MKLTHAFASKKISSREMTVEGIEENRLARSQPIARPLPLLRDRDRPEGSGSCGASVNDVIGQRSDSAMRALYQFMNRLMPRLIVRNTPMMSPIDSMAWPVWFSVVLAIDTMSW